jgi:hypothetical protein
MHGNEEHRFQNFIKVFLATGAGNKLPVAASGRMFIGARALVHSPRPNYKNASTAQTPCWL